MQFLILGPLEVSDDGRKLALGGPKQRAVLAHLILRANHVVPADLLIDGLGVLLIRSDGSQMSKIAAGGSEPSWHPDVL
jgi:hypothetical protein